MNDSPGMGKRWKFLNAGIFGILESNGAGREE